MGKRKRNPYLWLERKYLGSSAPVRQVRLAGKTLGSGKILPTQDWERIVGQIERGEVRVGPDAAREIAKRIESQGGFWGPREADRKTAEPSETVSVLRAA